MDELTITTPEHVPIGLEPAGAGSRFLAVLLDSLITTAIGGTIGTVAIALTTPGIGYAVFLTVSFLLTWSWHVWFETRGHGRTPGKRALSLRVVDARGLPVSLHQSLVRNIVRVIDFAPAFYGVGAAVSLFDPARRRLGDIVANTLVIREAQPLAYRGQLASERRHNSLRTPRGLARRGAPPKQPAHAAGTAPDPPSHPARGARVPAPRLPSRRKARPGIALRPQGGCGPLLPPQTRH